MMQVLETLKIEFKYVSDIYIANCEPKISFFHLILFHCISNTVLNISQKIEDS